MEKNNPPSKWLYRRLPLHRRHKPPKLIIAPPRSTPLPRVTTPLVLHLLSHLSPQIGDSPRSDFDFDFDVERKILVEAEKDIPNWSGIALGDIPQETPDQTDPGSSEDHILNTYIASGLNREAVPLAIAVVLAEMLRP